MLRQVKLFVKNLINSMSNTFSKTSIGNYFHESVLDEVMNRTTKVDHAGISLILTTPNALCVWRAKTFSTKEPETLAWIDNIPLKSIFWDIGSNVGLYSLYAICRKKTFLSCLVI